MEEQKLLKRRSKAIRDNNDTALASACTDLANLYMDEARYDFAIEEYTTVANNYKKQNKQLDYGIANRGIGEAYLGLHKFDKALHHLKIYLDTAREVKNKLEEQRALATMGHTYLSNYLEMPECDKNYLEFANKFFKKSLVVTQSLIGQVDKTELADMSARLFSNLGLVQDSMGNFKSAAELVTKSINLCKAHDLYEQLQRGYVSLASVLIKTGDHKSTLQQYNLAAEAAKKLRNKPGLLAGILLSKSEMLVKLGDLQGAKNTLLKAYKLKIPDVKEHKTIENNLRVGRSLAGTGQSRDRKQPIMCCLRTAESRDQKQPIMLNGEMIVASMCNTEDKLLITDAMDYTQLKKLYEKMGDGCCELKLFQKAIDYYKKMLDSAVKAGLTGSELGSCYYSLAETYKDNGQFDEAVAYFEQELELCQQFKDSLNTLSKIADTKETANAPVSEVQTVYNRAIELCQNENNLHEEGRMLKRSITYLRRQKQHSQAFQLEQDLAKLNYESSDGESENSEVQAGSVIGADVDLDAITDVSDDSDFEEPTTKTRRRNRNFQVRKNVKGETQLHTACIKGQLNVVHHLIEQGHPVHVRDNCGWLPLHEACINGHLEVVQLLLEKGAAINDRGGPQCEEPHGAICRILQEFSVSLDLSNQGLKGSKLSPLCKVLSRQSNLIELDLSGTFLTNECFQFLGASTASLENLCKLSLNCTGLRSEHVQVLINSLSPDVAYKVTDLDLSDNLIGDECFANLALLTRRFQLKKLNLSGNRFTRNLFNHSFNKELTLNLDQIEEFDLTDNDLSNDVVIRILSWLSSSNLKSVNVSRCCVTDGFLKEVLKNWTDAQGLKICRLSRCHVLDSDLFDLLRIAPSLETLDVSYCDDLTSISLRKLLQSDIETLLLYGCKNILRYFTEFSKYLDETSRDQNRGKTLKISLPENCDAEKAYLIQMWKDLYGDRAVTELSSQFLCLSLLK